MLDAATTTTKKFGNVPENNSAPPPRRHGGYLLEAAERGLLPDWLLRWGMRRLLKNRLRELRAQDAATSLDAFLQATQSLPIAVTPARANQQHYEVPAGFFLHVLGDHRKYSCCYWPSDTKDLSAAEAQALTLTCQHAELEDGQKILELGCGWGSLSLWMAQRYPHSPITAVSNSHSQRQFIEQQAQQRGLANLEVITADVNDYAPDNSYDRIVSVEMLEHLRNHTALLHRLHGWLQPHGKLFVHIFCHRQWPYFFQTAGEENWMGRYFFTGGMMPSADLLPRCADSFELVGRWEWNGLHYAKTCRAWLHNLDAAERQPSRATTHEAPPRSPISPHSGQAAQPATPDSMDESLPGILRATYGDSEARRWRQRWRMFFMACEELFQYNHGHEWFVSHYLFQRK